MLGSLTLNSQLLINKMKNIFLFLFSFISFQSSANILCDAPWYCRIEERRVYLKSNDYTQVAIRSGFLKESDQVPFRGNVIYYEGLGDSMVNHMPLFKKLTKAGYRVIAFDYMGQGGSNGSMDSTTIQGIIRLGNDIWNLYARDLQAFPKKTIIGWSTGGLAAFVQASTGDASNVVLIAPGLAPNIFVGETRILRGEINKITLQSLTSDRYINSQQDPHIDPIEPSSPIFVLNFVSDLLMTANYSRKQSIPSHVQGIVLLSGENDSYVDAKETANRIKKSANHFSVREYPDARHEIDNEVKWIRDVAHQDILDFLDKNTP